MIYSEPLENLSASQKLRIACIMALLRHDGDCRNTKELMQWLGCYEMIYPKYRVISFSMLEYLKDFCSRDIIVTASKMFKAWMLADLIECSLTEEEQDLVVLTLIRENYEQTNL